MKIALFASALALAACGAPAGEDTSQPEPAAREDRAGEGQGSAADAGTDPETRVRPAPAEPWTAPDLYRVSGVASGDVLNVRAEPRAEARKLGELASDASPVEVIATRDIDASRWAQVLKDGRPGWVNMAYLEPVEAETVAGSALPAALMCTGTEPFWGLEFAASSATYTDPEMDEPRTRTIEAVTLPTARGEFPVAVAFEGWDWAVITRERCSDAMSSDDYQWSVQYFTRIGETPAFLQGCCRIEPG